MMPAVVPPDDAGVMLVEFRRTFVYYLLLRTVEVSIHPTQPLDYCDARMSEQG